MKEQISIHCIFCLQCLGACLASAIEIALFVLPCISLYCASFSASMSHISQTFTHILSVLQTHKHSLSLILPQTLRKGNREREREREREWGLLPFKDNTQHARVECMRRRRGVSLHAADSFHSLFKRSYSLSLSRSFFL